MDPFIGEIRLMSFPFAPKNWAYCQGQLLSIQQYTALFSLLGVTYGGNGVSTFGLPDLRGRAIVGAGSGPGLSPYSPGQAGGTEGVTLAQTQMPKHDHTFSGTIQVGASPDFDLPTGSYPAQGDATQFASGTPNGTLNAGTLSGTLAAAGASQSHENRMPSLTLNYAIALNGYFPSRQ